MTSMRIPPRSDREPQRLEALREHGILDTDPERSYDDLVEIASYVAETPAALITLVDEDRQWVKAADGVPRSELPREISFCAHQISDPDEMLIVEDAREDPRFENNPLVEDEPHIRFYAGQPLRTEEGHVLGSLCVIDYEPRDLGEDQRTALEALGRQASINLDQRRERQRLEERIESLEDQLEDSGLGRV
jgi:GAF domain-containing protein